MNDVVTSHPLHEYLARELAERLDRRRIVVLYDSRSALVPFCDRELPPADETHVGASPLLHTGRMSTKVLSELASRRMFAPRSG
ncbi:MAG TPA: hypothetical protein VFH48_37930 [Chloroflexota bacterium]|nr:hypothetical protein [Chloroflexota bacterium]